MLGHACFGLKERVRGSRPAAALEKHWAETTLLGFRALQLNMLQFVCDYCETVKAPTETWINGVAAENVGTQAARREVIIDPAWRRERAIAPFAVHFCSIECKDNYLSELFNKPSELLEVESAKVEPGRRIVRAKKQAVSAAQQSRKSTVRRTGARLGKRKAKR